MDILRSRFLKDSLFGLLVCAMLFVAFYPTAKSAFLQALMKTGIFNAKMSTPPAAPIQAGDAIFTDKKGKVISLRALRGKVVFINIWATWCPPCRAEMPSLQTLYRRVKHHPHIVFLTVDADGEPARTSAFLKSNGYELPVVMPAGKLPAALFGGTLPTTVVIDRNGAVVFKHEGMADYSQKAFYERLKAL